MSKIIHDTLFKRIISRFVDINVQVKGCWVLCSSHGRDKSATHLSILVYFCPKVCRWSCETWLKKKEHFKFSKKKKTFYPFWNARGSVYMTGESRAHARACCRCQTVASVIFRGWSLMWFARAASLCTRTRACSLRLHTKYFSIIQKTLRHLRHFCLPSLWAEPSRCYQQLGAFPVYFSK